MALSPLAMLRSLALAGQGGGGFAVPQVQRAAVQPPTPRIAPRAPVSQADEVLATGGAPPAESVPLPRPRPQAGGGGSYAMPAGNAGLGKLKDILTATAMGISSVPEGSGIISGAAGGFAGAQRYKQSRADAAAAGARQAEQDALDAEYKRAQIANMERQASAPDLTDSQQDYQFYVAEERAAGREPLSYFDFKKTVGAASGTGQTERIITELMARGHSYEDALAMAQRAPNTSADNIARERLALAAAQKDDNWGYGDDEEVLRKWREYYGLEGEAPVKPPKKKGGGKGKKNKDQTAPEGADAPLQEPVATSKVYVNPDTGERIVYDGKAWVPAP